MLRPLATRTDKVSMTAGSPPRPPADDPRMSGLPPQAIPMLHAAARAIRDGAVPQATRYLDDALALVPEHPEALRLYGILYNRMQRHDQAHAVLQRALVQRPDDALILNDLASALYGIGEIQAAFDAWHRASQLAPDDPIIWFNLGRNLELQGRTEQAVDALERAIALDPRILPAQILLGDALVYLGRFDDADARYREALRLHPACGDAWRGLSNIKTRPLSDVDLAQLIDLHSRSDIADMDRIAMDYARGKALEDRQRYIEAFVAFTDANAGARQVAAWPASRFSAHVDAILAAMPSLHSAPSGPGSEVIFIVGMPRSGSTLFEQILAAHPQVEGASELADLGDVLREESMRRKQAFPQWIATADQTDWMRLGQRYLQLTARWRAQRPRHADKMPENWQYAGLLRAMLPGAVVIDTRRDVLETAWSCFKQQFYRAPHYTNDFGDLAAYIRNYERAMQVFRKDNQRIRSFAYEALLADPETVIRQLLDFCGLPFDPACLVSHQTQRSVRTASAAQVRQPLHRDTARTQHYGALLDPLRHALGLQPADSGARRT